MKKQSLFFFLVIQFCSYSQIQSNFLFKDINSSFEKNLGQVTSLDTKNQTEVLYFFKKENFTVFLLRNGVSFQFERFKPIKNSVDKDNLPFAIREGHFDSIETYRFDFNFENSNQKTIVEESDESKDYVNYYNHNALNVHRYKKITYKNLYDGIDWVIYFKNGDIKYDFIVKPYADLSQIKLKYSNFDSIYLEKNGNLNVECMLGSIKEDKPFSIQEDNNILTSFISSNNIVSYKVDNYDKSKVLVIDPRITWSTYYSKQTQNSGLTIDKSNNILLFGFTNSTTLIANSGFQSSFGGNYDFFIVKFDHNQNRLWSTYYGGSGLEICDPLALNSIITDSFNNIYIIGNSSSSSSISHLGFQNTKIGSGSNAILVKFDKHGNRKWGTYFGENSNFNGIAIDKNNNIYTIGSIVSNTSYSFNGFKNNSYESKDSTEVIFVTFDSFGNRVWSSYYGDSSQDVGNTIFVDDSFNIFIGGNTNSENNISFNGYQNSISTFGTKKRDGFIVKFDSSLNRIWGTYIGGVNHDYVISIISDGHDSLYILGKTLSNNNIAYNSNFVSTFTLTSNNGFLMKMNNSGQRIWSTYIEGNDAISIDDKSNIYVSANTYLNSGIYHEGFQSNNAGGSDVSITKFNSNGFRIWGSFFGGSQNESSSSVFYKNNNLFFSGSTFSNSGISKNGFQNNYISGSTYFLTKLTCSSDTTLYDTICRGDSFYFNGFHRKIQGTYIDTLDNWEYCDSFVTLQLTVHSLDTTYLFDTICSGYSKLFKGEGRTKTGIYRDTLSNKSGCDSFVILNLLVKRTDTTHIYDTSCDNTGHIFNGNLLTQTGIYRDTLTNAVSCDSHIFYHYIYKPIYRDTAYQSICTGDSIAFYGKYFRKTGIYSDTFHTAKNCDSIKTLNLSLRRIDTMLISQSICRGGSVFFGSNTLSNAGMYYTTFKNTVGCDSTIVLTLSIKDTSSYSYFHSICSGSSYFFNSQNLNTSGVYRDTFTNAQSCDSFVTLTLETNKILYDTIYNTICDGQTYRGFNKAGKYSQTFKSILNCDSFLTIYLTVLPPLDTRIETITHCGAILYQNKIYYQDDTIHTWRKNYLSCDSIHLVTYIDITDQNPIIKETSYVNFCEEITYKSKIYTQNFLTTDTMKSQIFPYCDSIYQPRYYLKISKPKITITATPSDTIVIGDNVLLTAKGAFSYIWSTRERNSQVSQNVRQDKEYYVIGWSDPDCRDTTSIHIIAVEPTILELPTGFSPKGSFSQNHIFRPNIQGAISNYKMDIYNRAGEKIFFTTDFTTGWNGKHIDQELPSGVYSYIVEYNSHKRRFIKTGEVMLVR